MTFTIIRLFFFHILFILLIGGFYLTSTTNPGAIPLYWGFYIGDQDYKKKDIVYFVKFLNLIEHIIVQFVIHVF